MMKNVLITGGAGFIGSNLSTELVKQGYNVRVLDNLSKQIHGNNPEKTSDTYRSIKDKVEFLYGDVTDCEAFQKAMNNQNAVIHLAAETGTGQSMYEMYKYSHVNICGTAIMLDYLTNKKNNIEKIIIASSRAVYGEGRYYCNMHGDVYPDERSVNDMIKGIFECKCPYCGEIVISKPTDENSRINPTSIYGITKYNQEQMVMNVGKTIGIPAVGLRYQNVYGPGQSLNNPYTGILSIFSNLIKNNKEINVFEDGQESRDFIFIKDVVAATITGLVSEKSNNNVFNVGSGISYKVIEVAEKLRDIYGVDVNIKISGNFRLGDIRHNYADLKKINTVLDYQPATKFEDGIKLFCEWVNNYDVANNGYDDSIRELRERGLYK